jgi:hypothetical protein
MEWLSLTAEHHYILTTAICWIQLRSISYSIDSIDTYKHVNTCGFFKDFVKNIAYCLYLPTLFLGPVILYQQFTDGVSFYFCIQECIIKQELFIIGYKEDFKDFFKQMLGTHVLRTY